MTCVSQGDCPITKSAIHKLALCSGTLIIVSILASGCATRIHPKDETIVPAKTPFSQFQSYWIKPVGKMPRVKVNPKHLDKFGTIINACMEGVFAGLKKFDAKDIVGQDRPLVSVRGLYESDESVIRRPLLKS